MKNKQAKISMSRNEVKTKFSFLFLFSIILLSGISLKGSGLSSDIIIQMENYPELERDWDNIDLLYSNSYHNSTEVDEEINRFHELVPELIDMEVIGQSYLGKNLTSLKISNELRTNQKAKTLVVAHHHSNEPISAEIALRFIIYLLNNYQVDDNITEFIDTQEIYVIPTVNPDGLDRYVDQDDHWLRKNLRPWDDDGDGLFDEDTWEDVNLDGIISSFDVFEKIDEELIFSYTYYEGIDNDGDGKVNEDPVGHTDLNRNYDVFWRDGFGWDPETTSHYYPGNTPFSEPETQAFRDFALKHRFGMAYTLHSGLNATIFPEDPDTGGWAEPSLYDKMQNDYYEILPTYFNLNDDPYSKIPTTTRACAGTMDNWMYHVRGTKAPVTYELYRNATSFSVSAETIIIDNSTHKVIEWSGIYGHFTPESSYIQALWEDVQPGFYYLLDNTPRLQIDIKVTAGGTKAGNKIGLNFDSINWSPRISTVEKIDILNSTEFIVASANAVPAASNTELEVDFRLSSDLADAGLELKIGNEFTGYTHFTILKSGTNFGLVIGLSVAGLAVVVGGTIAIIFLKRRK
ncbi:MAG: M14 family zinc carboxypeptidase [Candidatus Heimdallarchaeaceae archaeon]